jgi:hypothetical protein
MELTKPEMSAVELLDSVVKELDALDLSLIGGGMGDVVFA